MEVYPLVMTNSSPCYRWPIEIEGLSIKNGESFHGYVTNNQRGTPFILNAVGLSDNDPKSEFPQPRTTSILFSNAVALLTSHTALYGRSKTGSTHRWLFDATGFYKGSRPTKRPGSNPATLRNLPR